MIIFNDLEKLGYSKETINKFIDEDKVMVTSSGEYKIISIDLLVAIIKYYYPDYSSIINPNRFDIKVYSILMELFRLISLNQYLLASELSFRLSKAVNIHELDVINCYLDKSVSSINYIYPELAEKNNNKTYEDIQRAFLIDFIFDDKEGIIDKLKSLSKMYKAYLPLPFTIIQNYIKAYDRLDNNRLMINTRDYKDYKGEVMVVLNNLILSGDYIAAHQILKKYYIDNAEHEFIINFEIYRILDSLVIQLLDRNMDCVKKEIYLNSNGYNSLNEIIKSYDLSSLDANQVDKMSKKVDYCVDMNIDYMEEYRKNMDILNYDAAKVAIIKHIKQMEKKGLPCNLMYVLRELDLLIKNQEQDSIESNDKRNELINKANLLYKEHEYDEAIKNYKESFNHETECIPSTYGKIAECYMAKRDYLSACMCYRVEYEDYMSPMDYIHYIESLFYINLYVKNKKKNSFKSKNEERYYLECLKFIAEEKDIVRLAEEFEIIYTDHSSIVHYMLSIIYAMREDYEKAISEIESCETVFMLEYDLVLEFTYEKDILEQLSCGNKTRLYSIKDYMLHCYDDEFLNKIKLLDIDKTPEDGSLLIKILGEETDDRVEDRLDYLINLYRVLNLMNRYCDASDLFIYINELIKISNLTKEENEHFTNLMKKL